MFIFNILLRFKKLELKLYMLRSFILKLCIKFKDSFAVLYKKSIAEDYKKGFTILELLLVVLIISVLAGVGGSSYYAAAKNSRIEKEAREIANFIQEARSMAIDKVIREKPIDFKEMTGYEVKIKNDTTAENINVEMNMLYKKTSQVESSENLQNWSSKKKFKFTFPLAEPLKLIYEFGSGDLVIKDSDTTPNEVVKLDFDVLDELTNRKITFSLNRISGLLETR